MGKNQSVEQALSAYLRQGEKILWQSETAAFPLLEQGERWKIIGKWIGTVIATAIILLLYTGGREWSGAAVAAILVIAALLLLSPVYERYSLLGQRYWITDQRAILITRDRSFYYMELSGIDSFRHLQRKPAHDCLILGECIFEDIDRQLRWRSCHPKVDIQNDSRRGEALGMVFFSVEDGTCGADCLRQRQKI